MDGYRNIDGCLFSTNWSLNKDEKESWLYLLFLLVNLVTKPLNDLDGQREEMADMVETNGFPP